MFPSCAGGHRTPQSRGRGHAQPRPGQTRSISRTPRAEQTLSPLEGRALGTSSGPGQVQRLEQACLLTLDSRERHGFLLKSMRTIYGNENEFIERTLGASNKGLINVKTFTSHSESNHRLSKVVSEVTHLLHCTQGGGEGLGSKGRVRLTDRVTSPSSSQQTMPALTRAPVCSARCRQASRSHLRARPWLPWSKKGTAGTLEKGLA